MRNFVDEEALTPLPEDQRARLRNEWGVPAGAVVVGSVARLVPVKKHAAAHARAWDTYRAGTAIESLERMYDALVTRAA